MEVLILTLLFFIIVVPLVMGMTLPTYKAHHRATDGVINYDSAMKKFVYKVNLTSGEIIRLLEIKSDADELTCTLDLKKSIVKISEYGSNRDYYLYIQECEGCSIIKLEQVARIAMQSHVPYKLNPFMIRKLQAEIVPFSQYGF